MTRRSGGRPATTYDGVDLLLESLHEQRSGAGAQLARRDRLRQHSEGLRNGHRRVSISVVGAAHSHQSAQARHEERQRRDRADAAPTSGRVLPIGRVRSMLRSRGQRRDRIGKRRVLRGHARRGIHALLPCSLLLLLQALLRLHVRGRWPMRLALLLLKLALMLLQMLLLLLLLLLLRSVLLGTQQRRERVHQVRGGDWVRVPMGRLGGGELAKARRRHRLRG